MYATHSDDQQKIIARQPDDVKGSLASIFDLFEVDADPLRHVARRLCKTTCEACAATPGNLHVPYCEAEPCPICDEPAARCAHTLVPVF